MISRIKNKIRRLFKRKDKQLVFLNSSQYWDDRYKTGGNSGAGSYGRLAQFKSEVLNDFVSNHGINSVVEYGCGDGAQLELATYPEYVGFDISPKSVEICKQRFPNRKHYQFFETSDLYDKEHSFELSLSLDVIYHLIEDEVFDAYMKRLFASSRKYVIIYSNNVDKIFGSKHVKGRKFTQWVDEFEKNWELDKTIENSYPYDPADPNNTSHSDFFIFKRVT